MVVGGFHCIMWSHQLRVGLKLGCDNTNRMPRMLLKPFENLHYLLNMHFAFLKKNTFSSMLVVVIYIFRRYFHTAKFLTVGW